MSESGQPDARLSPEILPQSGNTFPQVNTVYTFWELPHQMP
jgi:hypothetical protein